ncbi:MAG: PAS domain S-box protein [Candidatus Tritonobacter lacicola]|nr:PAS domain S-box protein [Candidatus Tritonobacter lacicola]
MKILVADGNRAERKALSGTLSSLGHHAETASGNRVAVDKLRNGRFDIAFIDRDLPEQGGIELLEDILSLRLDTIPVITAARLTASDSIQAAYRGACDCVAKPLGPAEVETVIRRVLERQRPEKLLRGSLDEIIKTGRFYHDILENVRSGIWVTDRDDKVIYFNRQMEKISGVGRESVLGKNFFERFSYTLQREPELAQHYERAKSSLDIISYDSIRIKHDGARESIQSGVMYPLASGGSEFGGMVVTVEDITERKKAEEELALSRQWYQTIFDTANDAIFIHDARSGKILDSNEKMCEMYGYTKDETRKLTIGQLSKGIYPFTQEKAQEWVKKAFSGYPQIFEWVARHKEGRLFPVEVNLKRALIGGEERILAIIRDITARKKLEKELIHAEKMAGIGKLAAGIAHEFNNFLAMISGYAQLAKAGTLEDKDRAIDVAEKVSERAKVIVKNLISFAREDKPEKKPTDIVEVIEEALGPLSTQIKRQGITVKRRYSPAPLILCDPGQIRQVLFNIILNATQAMAAEGGELSIDLRAEDTEVVIKVADTGQGIPEEILEIIFDPFITTKGTIAGGDVSGTGLGLSVSYGLIKEHGGDIEAENNAGGGAIFTIRLPALTEAPPAEAAAAPQDRKPGISHAQARARIMVIDDEEVILALITDILKKQGKRVTAIQDPRLALSILKRESYDIIFLDLVMPGHPGGLGLFRKIKKAAPNARIVLLTGKEIDEEIKAALKEGACDLISKPFPVEEIKRIVEDALENGRQKR